MDPQEDETLLLDVAAGADRAKIRHSLVCDFEFWVSFDPDFTVYPGDNLYMLRMQLPSSAPNSSDKTSFRSGHGNLDTNVITTNNAWNDSGYTDLVQNGDRSDSDDDQNNTSNNNSSSAIISGLADTSNNEISLSGVNSTEQAKHDISGKILWLLTNQDSDNNNGIINNNNNRNNRERRRRIRNGTEVNLRKLHESDRFWTLAMLFLLSVLVLVVLLFYKLHKFWWVVLIGLLVYIILLIILNRRYESGYNQYYNNRMYELMQLCVKLNQHENGYYKECFFELFQKETMGVIACCSTRQYQRKAMIRVTPFVRA